MAVIFFLSYKVINSNPYGGDAIYNARMAYNFAKYGVLSGQAENGEKPGPTNYREPVTPIAAAFIIRFHPRIGSDVTQESLYDGKYIRYVKQVNLLWSFMLLIGCALLAHLLFNNKLLTLLSLFFIAVQFLIPDGGGILLNSLLTELPAATLIVWASLFLVIAFRNHKYVSLLLAGTTLGLLALTRGPFLQVIVGLYIIFLIHTLCEYREYSYKFKLKYVILFGLAIALVITPWMIRNKIHFDSFEITQRGGVVLLIRAYKNQMNSEEYFASFHIYGPPLYKRIIKGTNLDVDSDQYKFGGSLQRLNRLPAGCDRSAEREGRPEDACSFYTMARAERVKANREFAEMGIENPTHNADQFLYHKALNLILQEPWKQLLMTIPFFWRGIWSFQLPVIPLINLDDLLPGNQLRYLIDLFSFVCMINLFMLFFLSLFRKKWDIVALTSLVVGMILFYSLLSHNITRFNVPAIPIMLISFIYTLRYLTLYTFTKLKRLKSEETTSSE